MDFKKFKERLLTRKSKNQQGKTQFEVDAEAEYLEYLNFANSSKEKIGTIETFQNENGEDVTIVYTKKGPIILKEKDGARTYQGVHSGKDVDGKKQQFYSKITITTEEKLSTDFTPYKIAYVKGVTRKKDGSYLKIDGDSSRHGVYNRPLTHSEVLEAKRHNWNMDVFYDICGEFDDAKKLIEQSDLPIK